MPVDGKILAHHNLRATPVVHDGAVPESQSRLPWLGVVLNLAGLRGS